MLFDLPKIPKAYSFNNINSNSDQRFFHYQQLDAIYAARMARAEAVREHFRAFGRAVKNIINAVIGKQS